MKEFSTERSSPLITNLVPDRLPQFVRQSLQPVEEIVDWGSHGKHRLAWRDGSFELPQHEDLELERALEALGGTLCPCLRIARLLTRGPQDPTSLQALSLTDNLPIERVLNLRRMFLPLAGPDESERLTRSYDDLFALALPAPLRLRVGLSLVAWYASRWDDSGVRAVTRRQLDTIYGGWVDELLGEFLPDKKGPARVHVLDPGEPVAVEAWGPGHIELSLPVTWAFAWAARPTIENDLVLDLSETSEPNQLVATVAAIEDGTLGPVRQKLVGHPA